MYPFAPWVKEKAEAVLSAIPRVKLLPTPFAVIPTVDPLILTAPVVLPIVKVDPLPVATKVLPLDERVVNAPLAAVVTPIAVLLIPVADVLKLPEVKVISLTPRLILDADRPERESEPDVPVRLNAPVVWVNPLEAVSKPAEVIVPVPVVKILPLVESVPASVIVKVGVPPL
jgi:hypothetical protein